MAWKAIYKEVPVENPKADYRAAVRIGNFRFGREALYLPAFPTGAQYLPLAALDRAWVQKSAVSAKCCCGAQVPVYVVRLQYGGTFYQNLTFDTEKEATRVLELLKTARPELAGAPEQAAAGN